MKRNVILKSIFTLITVFSVLFTSCDSWMSDDDDFYKEIEEEVRVANATEISTFVRFAATREGITTPSGASTVKVDVPFQVSCTAELEYAFYKWAAFSSEGTNGFSTSSQHTNFFYVDDEDYLVNYADKELPESVVSFSNPTDTTTRVTIHEARNDIFIIPVVANRPIVSTSLPSPGQTNVVRNMTIRIVFSKPMDASTLMVPYDSDNDGEFDDADGDGEPDEYRLSENIIVYKSTGDFDNMTLTDITDEYTNVSLGATKKTLSFRQGPGLQLDSNTTIQVQILSDVKDACGYTMADKHTLQFVTGNSSDSQAPRVEKLYAGPTAHALSSTSTSWGSNQSYYASDENTTYFVPTVENQSSSYVNKAASIDGGATSQILTHRTKGPVYIYAYARDTSENSSAGLESDVYQLYLRATHLVYPDASLVSEENRTSLARTASAYNPGGRATGVTREVSSDLGYVFKYDVSDLPDGLIRIDVAAVDTIGNDGFSSACINASTNQNYYKSIYVVKDTTAPDSDVEKDKVTSAEVTSAPYHWFNESSIADLKIQQTSYATNPLVDRYDQNLASPYDKLSWCFSLDGGEIWTDWAYVTTDYSITNAAEIARDGIVLINYKLKDDLGNESEIQTLNSITYDNTKPVVDELKWIDSADNASSERVLGATQSGVLPVLRVPFTEEMSGIKKPVITIVQVDGTATGTAASAEYRYESETVENEEAPVTNDTNNGIVFSDTTAKYKTGYFTISNLNLGTNEGQYTISVNLMDQAMNLAAASKVINAIKDATPPVINTIKIVDLKKVEYADNAASSVKYFAPYSAIHPDESGEKYADTLTLEYNITEAGTGVQEISLGGTTVLTASSRLQTQNASGEWESYENSEDITYNVTDNKITFVNYDTPKLKGTNLKFRITNVKFQNTGATNYNTIESSLKDFVNLASASPKTSFTYEDSSTTNAVDRVYVDVAAPSFAETNPLVFKDKSSDSNLYTNDSSITVEASFTADSASGLKTVTLTGASFPAGGADLSVYVDSVSTSNLLASTAYSVNGTSITFEKVYMNAHTLIFKGVVLDSGAEGSRNISATITDTTGWTSASATSNTITYDITAPVIDDGAMSWVADAGHTPRITAETVLEHQKLVIPFTEVTAGVKKVKVEITHDDEITAYASPFSSSAFAISYNDVAVTGSANGQIYTLSEQKTTGTFTLSNLTLAASSAEGTYHVKVTLIDIAENEQTVSRTISIFKDTTAPVINSIKIIDLQKIEYADNSTTPVKYFAPYNTIHEDASGNKYADALTLEYNVTEAATGIKEISLGATTVLTDSSRLQKQNASGEWESCETDITYNVSDNKISITNFDSAYLKGTNIKFRITNVKFTNAGATDYNTISSTLKDFVNLTSAAKTNFTYENGSSTSSVDSVYVDVAAPEFAATDPLVIKDFSSNSSLHTNDSSVTVEVSFTADSASGLKTVTLTGASFPESGAGLSVYVDSVSTSNLLASTAYTVNGSSITFEKVYMNAHTLIFKGVNLNSGNEGLRNISATITDTTGWTSASATSNTIIYDITAPTIAENAMTWNATSSEYTAGITSENILAHQNLVIPFTEATAGIKKIKVEVTYGDETTVYASPFASTSPAFGVYYGTSITALTGSASGTTYTLDTVQTSGTITLKNLAIASAAAEGTYHVKVTLTDIAENEQSVSRTINIYKDTVAAQVTKIEVKGLKKSQEKVASGTTATTTETRYFLEKEYVRDDYTNSNTAPTKVCVYLTINETNTGVKQINLKTASASTAVLQDSTKVYIVSNHGASETLTDVTDKLTFDKTNQIITVTDSNDSASLFKGSDLVLLLENLKFSGCSTTPNYIYVKAYDVAQNSPASAMSTITQGSASITSFYSDSWSPYITSLTLKDRAATGYLKASSNYTNESIVDVLVYTSKEGDGSSGIYSFKITSGAYFTSNTTVKVGNSDSAVYAIDGLTFELSSSTGGSNYDTITFKSLTDSELYYVIRNHSYFYFTNLQFSDTSDGSHTVSMYAYDLAGWASRTSSTATSAAVQSASIKLDTQAPEWVYTGPRVYVNSSKLDNTKVYPKSGGAYGVTVDSNLKNKDGKTVTYFYSNAKGLDDYTLRDSTKNGVLLQIYGSDDQSLYRGSNGRTHYYYYYHSSTDTIANIDAEYVLTHSAISSGSTIPTTPGTGINPEYDATNTYLSTSSSSIITSKALYQYFPVGGTYSIVIADEAGNYSPAYTITVVEDGTVPSVKLSDGSTSIADVVTYENDEVGSASKMIKNGVAARPFSWGDDLGGSQVINSDRFLLADSINKIRIRLGSTLSSTDVVLNKATHTSKTVKYGEINPDVIQSGLQAYAVTVAYNGSLGEDYALGPDSTTIYTTTNYSTSFATLPKWRSYTIPASTSAQVAYADGTLYSYVDTNGDIIVQIPKGTAVPVITLFLMDNCGNINKKFLNSDSDPYFMYVDNKLGENTITATSTDHVIQCPIAYPSEDNFFKFYQQDYKHVTSPSLIAYRSGARTSSYRGDSTETSLPYNSRLGELVRDLTKNVNYYTNKAVMLLALPTEQYSSSSSDVYNISTGNPSFDTYNYSMKSKLLAVPVTASAPTYNDFATITNSRASEWTYCLWSGTNYLNTAHAYPQVNYTALGWDKTEPYYIYYIVEDAVGNYKIGKVVNSLSDSAMDKWLYDNEGPVLTVNKEGVARNPSALTGADIQYLVPSNNGYRSYFDGTNGWVWSTTSLRTGLYTELTGNGVNSTSKISGYWYNPSFNISVSEATGVRAFHYSTSSEAPDVRVWPVETDNSGDADQRFGTYSDDCWFAGWGVKGAYREIGSSGTASVDDDDGSGYMTSGYLISDYVAYNTYDASTYGSTYSGTKVSRILPVDFLSSSSETPIYLHVMDWAGNVSTYRMGNFSWKKDTTAPSISLNSTYATAYSQSNYYMEYDSTNARVKLQIAGVGKTSDNGTISVYPPLYTSTQTTGWHNDTDSGIGGFVYYSDDNKDVRNVNVDSNGKYFVLDYADYESWSASLPTANTGYYAYYDNVGNRSVVNFVGAKDDQAPALHPEIFAGTKTTSTYLYKQGDDERATESIEPEVTSDESTVSKDVGAEDFTCSTYYIKGSSVYFKPYISAPSETGLKFYLAGWNSSSSTWSDISNIDYDYSSDTNDSISVMLTNGGYYRLSIADQVGNSRFAYFHLYQDTTAPVFASTPAVTSKTGGELYTNNSKKYHNGLNISLDSADAGSGIDKYNIKFTYSDSTTYTSTGNYATSVTYTPDVTKEYGLDTVIKVTTSDKLGNETSEQNLGTFVYDNQAPEFNSATSTNKAWTVWVGWVTQTEYEKEANVSLFASAGDGDSRHYNFLITDTSTSKVQFTPKATDLVSGVKGWYESTSSTKPETIADSSLKTSFTHTTSTDGSKDITLSSGATKVYYYFAVDNVGNIADPIQVTYKYSSYGVPTVTSWTFGSDTILSHTTDKNYYNTLDLVFNVKLEGISSDNTKYAPTGLLFILDGDYSKQGIYPASTDWINVTPNGDGTYTVTASLPESLELEDENGDPVVTAIDNHSIGVYVYNSYSYSTCQQIVYEDTASFEKDTTGPEISAVSVSADTTGQYLSGNDIFFKSGNENVSVTVSGASDQAGIWSYAIVPATNDSPECPASAMEGESLTLQISPAPTENTDYKLYVWDKVKNRTEIGTYTLKPDASITAISTVSVSSSGSEGSIYRSSADSTDIWFKGTPVVSVSTSLTDSDIAYCYYDSDYTEKRGTIDGSTVTFAITPTEGVTDETHSLYLVDKVGNISDGYTLTFRRDETAPSDPVVMLTSLTNIVTLSDGTYTAVTEDSEGAGVKTLTASETYYINGTTYASGLPLKAASSDAGSGLSGLEVHFEETDYDFDYDENTGYTSAVTPSANTSVEVTVKASDNLGNISTFVFNLFKDSTLPAPASVGGAPNYGGVSTASDVQFDYGSGAVAIKGVTNTDGSYTCTLDEGNALFTMYDSAIGTDYATVSYVGNISFTLKVADDIVAYAFVNGTSALTASTVSWTSIRPDGNGAITVSPATHNTTLHQFYFIWLKDRVGNVAVYNLGNPADMWSNWWIQSTPTTEPKFNVIIADGGTHASYWSPTDSTKDVNVWSVDIILGNLSPTAAIKTLEFDGYKIFGNTCRFVDAYFNESFTIYTGDTTSYNATYVAKDSNTTVDQSGNAVTCTLASNDTNAEKDGYAAYETYGNFQIVFSKPYIHAGGKMAIHFDIEKKSDTTLATDNGVLKVKDGEDESGNPTYVDINSKFHFVTFEEAGHTAITGTSVVVADTTLARSLAPASGNFFTKAVSSAVSFVAQKTKTLFTRKPASKEKITSVNSKNFGSFLPKEQKNTSQSVINTDNIISNEKVLSAGSASAALIDSSVAESSESIQVMQASPIDSSISQPKASITSVGESEGQLAEPSSSGKAPVILAIILSLVFIGTLLVIVRHNVDKRKTSKI